MNRQLLRFFFSVLCCWLLVQPLAAQKPSRDARPLQGLERGNIPRYASVEAFLRARPPADLRSRATVVGHAGRVTRSLAPRITLPAGPPTPSQQARPFGTLRIERAPNGTVRWMQGSLGRLEGGAGKQGAAFVQAAASLLQDHAALLRLDRPAEELRPVETRTDALGYVHARFEQTYRGIPLWARDLYVHFDAHGEVYAVNGTYEPTPVGVNTTPTLSAETALRTVIGDLQAQQRWAPLPEETARWLGIDGPATGLVLYPDAERGMRLAHEVSLHPNLLEWYTYLVDAHTGAILNRIARHCTLYYDPDLRAPVHAPEIVLPDVATPAPSRVGFLDVAAEDLNDVSRTLRVYQHTDGVYYAVSDLDNLDAGQFQLPNLPGIGGAVTLSAQDKDLTNETELFFVTSGDNSWTDPASVSAHFNMQITYDYFKSTFGRKAINDQDEPLLSIIHVTRDGQSMENAFWSGRVMAYGNGGQFFKPLAGGLDVAGHEMSHGVIQHTAGLVYQFQSGALNESFADVFGAMVDREDLLMGEDIMQQHLALRDLERPDNPQIPDPQPAHMSQFQNLTADQDNGGVHINSGIPNRAAALVIQALGHEKTEQIYYRALSSYLTRNSQFGDARNAVEQAAADLFGSGGPEVSAVQQAFDAVGITSTTGTGGGGSNDLPPQTGGQSLITLLLEDGSISLLDPANPAGAGVFDNPQARARADAENSDFAQLSTPRSGARIWFVNQQFQLANIDVQSGQVEVFEELSIQQPGDLWNASVSPNEDYVALVSAYAGDPTLYLFDGEQLGAIDLKPETTQEGIQDESIQYPDVVSWSPNMQVPHIAFDAFNEVDVAGTAVSYWSIYEIDFEAGKIYGLLPAQPADLSVGNITYSSTNPDVFAFNAIEASGTWDVLVGDFESGEIAALEIPSYTLEGTAITDAQRPTFAPDDTQLCFTSPSLGILLFYDLASGGLSYLDFQAALHNPRWFMLGGSAGTQNQAPAASFTATPTTGTAPLQISVDASASSDPNGDPLTYRWDFGDGSVGSSVTAAHTYAFAGTFTITLTVTDGGGLSGEVSQQVQVAATGVPVESGAELPKAVALHQNHPNPFNPATVLRFDLPAPVEVTLEVFDVMGRSVITLAEGAWPAGVHEVRFEAGRLPSGVYVARLRAGRVLQTRKMVLLR